MEESLAARLSSVVVTVSFPQMLIVRESLHQKRLYALQDRCLNLSRLESKHKVIRVSYFIKQISKEPFPEVCFLILFSWRNLGTSFSSVKTVGYVNVSSLC